MPVLDIFTQRFIDAIALLWCQVGHLCLILQINTHIGQIMRLECLGNRFRAAALGARP